MARIHWHDSDCKPFLNGRTQVCRVCNVWHADPCPDCGGRGYHNSGCPHTRAAAQMQAIQQATAFKAL